MGMVRPHGLFLYSQGSFVEGLGLGILALDVVDGRHCSVVKCVVLISGHFQ